MNDNVASTTLKPKNGPEPSWKDERAGYYYAYSPSGSVATYKKASATIILPTEWRLKGSGGGRNAYISFGVLCGSKGWVDIGIRNCGLDGGGDYGLGWEAYCFEARGTQGHYFKNKRAPSGTKRAKVEITPDLTYTNKIRLSVQWLDSNNNVIDASKNINEDITLIQTYPWDSFFRFASLVTEAKNWSTSDGTKLLGGGFDSVKLGSANWGISTDLVGYAFIVNPTKCQLPYGYWATGEEFRINHRA